MLLQQRKILMDKKQIYDQGIGKLVETKGDVGDMQMKLNTLQPQLQDKEQCCKVLMAKIAYE
jgi:hypothetical protein